TPSSAARNPTRPCSSACSRTGPATGPPKESMANRTHSLLVIDLEATCWQGDPPPGMQSEVIEVGIAELDTRALEITRAEAIFVRPQHSEVSPFCTRLTSIAPEHVADAPTFPEDAERLR